MFTPATGPPFLSQRADSFFSYLWPVKAVIIFSLFFSAAIHAQDKVYLLNGELVEGKVLEINPDEIILDSGSGRETIVKTNILLIEFKNKQVERINTPEKSVIVQPTGDRFLKKPPAETDDKLNQLSINTLAFINADISLFYERLSRGKKVGYGVMGGYNFNKYVISYNTFMYLLTNAKKKMDAGIFLNYYPGKLKKKKDIFVGVLFKYTSFDFSYMHEDTVWNGGQSSINVRYTPASGYQFATMLTVGGHYKINQNLFIKTLLGIGGFNLRGDFYQQFNYMLNQGADPRNKVDFHFLPKIYFGFNIGYNF